MARMTTRMHTVGLLAVFARLVQDQKEETGAAGLRVRDAFLRDLPARLEAL
jgi:bla regulator protein BlaR1